MTNTAGVQVLPMASSASAAEETIKYYMLWAAGAGALPIPLVDLAAIIGVQVRMTRKLAELYRVDFSATRVKTIATSLTGTVAAGAFAGMVKFIPIVGQAVGAVSMPIFAGAATYALGRVFALHFATGGTLLDFDADKVRDHFRKEFETGKSVASEARKNQ